VVEACRADLPQDAIGHVKGIQQRAQADGNLHQEMVAMFMLWDLQGEISADSATAVKQQLELRIPSLPDSSHRILWQTLFAKKMCANTSASLLDGVDYKQQLKTLLSQMEVLHATKSATLYPLVEKGIISADALLTCHSITGYSGGGKKMIAEYEDEGRSPLFDAPRQYALGQTHKHLKEMKAITGLSNEPVFCPIVSDFYSGMTVTVPIFASQLCDGYTVEDIKALYAQRYTGEIVKYVENADESGLISGAKLSGYDSMQISVAGNSERILLIAMYDNLGKGASGAAVECLNYVLGTNKSEGLQIAK
jgi:hypothetical protein